MNKTIAITTLALAASFVNAQRLELRATLTGIGKGKSVWKTRDQIGQLQAELSVEAENLRPGALYRIMVGTQSWQLAASALGTLKLSQRYIGPNRPTVSSGTIVQIRTAAGAVVLRGVYQ